MEISPISFFEEDTKMLSTQLKEKIGRDFI